MVSVLLGVYANVHDPTGRALFTSFFTATINLKSWLATLALGLAGFQVLSAMRLYGKIGFPRRTPPWLGDAHRISGTLAFVATLPVAFHCLWSIGFATPLDDPRRVVHSVLGCLFYGAFATKIAVVRSHGLAGWILPAAGGTVFAILVGLWWSSALWFFNNAGFPSI